MNLRRILLRLMLISLTVAAVVGAASVLFLPASEVGRIFGTGVLTAVACGVLLPISVLTDKPRSRAAGLAGMAAVLVEYLLVLVLIWDRFSAGWDQLGLTSLFFPAVAIPAVVLLRIAGTSLGRWAGRVGVALAAAEFVMLMIATWSDALGQDDDHWYVTAGVCAIFFPLMILSLAGLATAPGRLWRWPAIIASCVSLFMALVGVWHEVANHYPGAYALLISVSAALAYVNVAMLCPLKAGQVWVRWVAMAAVILTAASIDCGVFTDAGGNGELFGRIGAATGIIAGCATLALAILATLNRKIERPSITLDEIHSVEVTCPLCRKKQSIGTGSASCMECGLRMFMRLEQPQCVKCGYVLYRMKSGNCPECGIAIEAGNSTVSPAAV